MSRRPFDRIRAGDSGAALAEFALILPLLVMLLMGVVEFGRAYNMKIALVGAAREGARALALCGDVTTCTTVEGAINDRTPFTVTLSEIEQSGCSAVERKARVVVSKSFTFGIPMLPVSLGTVTLKGDAAMRCGL